MTVESGPKMGTWTDDEIRQFVAFYNSGVLPRDIGPLINRTPAACCRKMDYLRKEPNGWGLISAEEAKALREKPESVADDGGWSDDDLFDLYASQHPRDGASPMSFRNIASVLGRSELGCKGRYAELRHDDLQAERS